MTMELLHVLSTISPTYFEVQQLRKSGKDAMRKHYGLLISYDCGKMWVIDSVDIHRGGAMKNLSWLTMAVQTLTNARSPRGVALG